MSKFWYLVGYTLKKRVKTKAFIIANIFIFILILFITCLPSIIVRFSKEDSLQKIAVYDETSDKKAFEFLKASQGVSLDLIEYFYIDKEFDEIDREKTLNNYEAAILVYTEDSVVKAKVINDNLLIQNEIAMQSDLNSMKQMLWAEKNPDKIEDINSFFTPIEINFISFEEEDDSAVIDGILLAIAMIIIVPVFIMLIMLMNFVGMDILEEKSSRSVEVIVSNVKITHHFFSKIVSAMFFMLIQGVCLFVFMLISSVISLSILSSVMDTGNVFDSLGSVIGVEGIIVTDILKRIPGVLFATVIFVFFGYLFYLVLMSVFAAMATSMEDFAQFQMPVMLLLLVGFYVAIFSLPFGENAFIKVLAYIPLFSPMLAPALFINGSFGIIDCLIALVLLIGINGVVIYFGMPLYKVSILNYSQESFFKRIIRLIKKSKHAD